MIWTVTLSGSHWRDVDPSLFREHQSVPDWSTVECDEVDVSGEMVELRRGEIKLLVPCGAILAAIKA
jgi:hypothetical protein